MVMTVLTQSLGEYIADYERNWPLGGVVFVAQHGEIVLRKAFGYASIEHHVPNTLDSEYGL
ncbi:hypothetical protein ABU162_05480 [Paenibacillus thiaminolyticus]|uniref:hypothetical protein n=1 Tax=Paenibacillus thiaminolyticus TaxID=49283 RepID=UPI0035A62930